MQDKEKEEEMEQAKADRIRGWPHHRGEIAAGGGEPGEVCLDEYLDRIARELHERVEHQRTVLRRALDGSDAGRNPIPYCPLVDCTRVERLRSAIRETIVVLEETRTAFKSKRLEVMRKALIEILAES